MRRHSAHVDANVLAELSAGLISGRRATRIHAHLAGCQRCASVSAGLSGVPVLLASVPPSPMPEAVTARLSAAIWNVGDSARTTCCRRPMLIVTVAKSQRSSSHMAPSWRAASVMMPR